MHSAGKRNAQVKTIDIAISNEHNRSPYAHLMQYFEEKVNHLWYIFSELETFRDDLYKEVVSLILEYCPNHILQTLFIPNTACRNHLEEILNAQLLQYPDIDLDMDLRGLAKTLHKSKLDNNTAALERKLAFMIISRGVLAYIAWNDKKWAKAFKSFRWCLSLIYCLKRYCNLTDELTKYMTDCDRSFSLLCANCLIQEIDQKGDDWALLQTFDIKMDETVVLQSLLCNILECTEPDMMSTNDVLDQYLLSEFFKSLAEIEGNLSIFKGILTEYECDDLFCDYGLRCQRSSLEEMIKKYIISATLKVEGDHSIVSSYDKIIQSILLYGGLHIEVFAFFFAVRQYFSSLYSLLPGAQGSQLVQECYAMVTELVNEWNTIKSSDNSNMIQVPQVLLRSINGAILMVDEVYNESLHDHDHDIALFLSSIKLRAKMKLYGESQIRGNCTKELWFIGKAWIQFWETCYIDNKGTIPKELSLLLSEVHE